MATKRQRVTRDPKAIGTWPTPERPATGTWPATLKVDIEPKGLKRVVEEGRLLEFVEAFSTLAAEHIKVQIVDHLAKSGVGVAELGKGIGIAIGFDLDWPYGMGPKPWPWPPPPWSVLTSGLREQVREVVVEELQRTGKL